MTTDKMESESGDTGGRTRTVFIDTALETETFAEALARRDAPTPDIGVPARTAGGGYAYAAWLARAERLAGTCDRPGSAWLKSAILRALPAGSQTERKAVRWAQQDNGSGTVAHVIESIARLTDSRAAVEWADNDRALQQLDGQVRAATSKQLRDSASKTLDTALANGMHLADNSGDLLRRQFAKFVRAIPDGTIRGIIRDATPANRLWDNFAGTFSAYCEPWHTAIDDGISAATTDGAYA